MKPMYSKAGGMIWIILTLVGLAGALGQPSVHHRSAPVYTPGNTLTITNEVVYTGSLWSLLWRPLLPAGWTLLGASGDGNPELVNGEMVWTGPLPPSPIRMVYIVQASALATGPQSIHGEVEYQLAGMVNPDGAYAEPNPLVLTRPALPPVGTVQIRHASAPYVAGTLISVTNTFTYTNNLWSLLWRPRLPEGWSLETISGDGNLEMLGGEILWSGVLPPSPIHLVYTVLVPMGASGTQPIQGEVEYQFAGQLNPATGYAEPNPLLVGPQPGPAVTHQTGAYYMAGGTFSVTNQLTYTHPLWSLLWRPQLPEGWKVESVSGDGNPELSGGEILWTGALPPSPIQMVYTIRAPTEAAGTLQIHSEVEYLFAGLVNPITVMAQKDPLKVAAAGGPTAAQRSATQYTPGTTLSVTNTFAYTNTLWSLLWRPRMSAGWALISASGDGQPELKSDEILWPGTLPPSPIQMIYTVQVPPNATENQEIRSEVEYQFAGMVNPATVLADPDPLVLASPFHKTNRAPVLFMPVDQTIDALSTLIVTVTATDPDLPTDTLLYSLVAGPTNMSINPLTGVLSWTPNEIQAPSTNVVVVQVTDNGTPPLSDTNSFTVVVRAPGIQPEITMQPQHQVVALGANVNFSVTATGTPPLTYQWRKNGVNLANRGNVSGAISPELHLASVQTNDAGSYSVSISNMIGSVISRDALLTVTGPAPAPDLAVTRVMIPALALPHQPFDIEWAVTNQGNSAAVGPWDDQIFLARSATGQENQAVGTFAFTGETLVVGQSFVQKQQITLPFLESGHFWAVVRTDNAHQVREQNEENNTTISSGPLLVPPVLDLSLASASTVENAGSSAVTAVLSRNAGLHQPLTVTLTCDNPQRLIVPATVVVPAGQFSTPFTLGAQDNMIFDGDTNILIIASATGYTNATAPLMVIDNEIPLLRLGVVPASFSETAGSSAATGTVTRNTDTQSSLTVSLMSDDPSEALVPATVVIPSGQASATFSVTAVDDLDLDGTRPVILTAMAAGFASSSATVEVTDDERLTLALTTADPQVVEGSPSPATLGTVRRSLVNNDGLRIALESRNPDAVTVPIEVTIPAQEAMVEFPVNVLEDSLVNGTRTVTLIARVIMPDGSLTELGSASTTIEVLDNDGPTLALFMANPLIREGQSSPATVTRNTGTDSNLVVNLLSSNPAQATVPASVMIPAGQVAADFVISAVSDGVADGVQDVLITASAPGFNAGSVTIQATDIEVPDLLVSAVTFAATNGFTGDTLAIQWTINNAGLAVAPGSWIDRVWISADPLAGDDTLIANVTHHGGLGAGQFYTETDAITLPETSGTYWIVVTTDATNAVEESAEGNNTAVSEPSILVNPPYRALVETDLEVAPNGTPVPLRGRAYLSSTLAPAPHQPVTIRIRVRDTRRVWTVRTDQDGNFETVFQPLPTEAGHYTVGADHPGAALDPVQDTFELVGIWPNPISLELRLAPQQPLSGTIELRNLGEGTLTGLTVALSNAPAHITAQFDTPATLAADATNQLHYTFTATGAEPSEWACWLQMRTAQGARCDLPVSFTIIPLAPHLLANPSYLARGMVRGGQSLVPVEIINTGGVASGDLIVALPVAPWLSLVSSNTIPSLPPGGSTLITLALTPAADLPLMEYQGLIEVGNATVHLSIPFQFRALSTALGELRVTVVDDYTYYAIGSPKVAGARVMLKDAYDPSLILAEGISDAYGVARFASVLEGTYLLEVEAAKHHSYRQPCTIVAGGLTEVEAFLPRQLIAYRWVVTPLDLQDHYEVILETLFEAEAPMPVVTIEAPLEVQGPALGEQRQIDVTLTNHGLMAAQEVTFSTTELASYIATPLITDVGTLPARSAITIPVIIERKPTVGGASIQDQQRGLISAASAGGSGGGEGVTFGSKNKTPCGGRMIIHAASRDCLIWDFNYRNQPGLLSIAWQWIKGFIISNSKEETKPTPSSGGIRGQIEVRPPNYLASANACRSGGPTVGTASLSAFNASTMVIDRFSALSIPMNSGKNLDTLPSNICAQVTLHLDQEAVMTRSAFQGTFQIDNDSAAGAIEGIRLALDIRDANEQPANNRFFTSEPELTGLTGIDGAGSIEAHSTGSARFLFIPAHDAATNGPADYTIGGTLRYLDPESGQEVVVPIFPAFITVYPDARLRLKYFHQRDVYGDNPETEEIEPAEPFVLGLLVQNAGLGRARDFRLTSAQPRIVDNKKGLLIDFKLIGSQVGNQSIAPSLTVVLGDLDPGSNQVASWSFVASLQGKFLDYKAEFEHADEVGGWRTSLIESTEIHELIHVVQADRPGDDTLMDYLVNDVPDPENLPDTLYLSDGTVAPVNRATSPIISSIPGPDQLEVQLTALATSGWNYLRVTNPGPELRLLRVSRSDGKTLSLGTNAWTTDRSFPEALTGVRLEHLLHLVDYDSPGSYTLTYGLISPDSIAPVSAVTPLPDYSPEQIPVSWSGTDAGSGLAFYEIWVSTQGGPFALWLSTTATAALYPGHPGAHYAFYSLAHDYAGNVEDPPSVLDAQTTVLSVTNHAPVLSPLADQIIAELTPLILTNTATDSDLPANTLTFTLVNGPANMTVHLATGVLNWTPTEAQGPSTNRVTVQVTDNGAPALSDTKSFTVMVREVNTAPVLTVPANQTLNELTSLVLTNTATDADLPANTLTFSLVNSPANMTLHPATGALNWTPTEAQGHSTNVITVQVADNGVPTLSDTKSFTVVVNVLGIKPSITQQPLSQTVVAGQTITLSVVATGTTPLRYQWRKNNADLANGGSVAGATDSILTLANVQTNDSGAYQVVVGNNYGSVTSQVAVLNVTTGGPLPTGIVVAWGQNLWGQSTVPEGLTNVVAIAAGRLHSLALKAEGTVVGWGEGGSGQTTPPANLSNAVAIAAGRFHSLALRRDGSVTVWGSNDNGQTNVPALNNPMAIAAGSFHCLALQADGRVIAWGGDPMFAQTNIPPGLSDVTAISAGVYASLALKRDGTVVTWGYSPDRISAIPAGLSNVVAIAVGADHALALKKDSTVTAWGNNTYGQTNVPPGLSNVVAITAGFNHNLALKADGSLIGWGYNQYGQADPPADLTNILAIAAGGTHSLALCQTGSPPVVTNRPPVLTVPATQTIDELTTLSITNTATDPDLPAQTLTFSLVSGPTNMTIHPTTGLLTWTPTASQCPSTNVVIVRVTDNGVPALSDIRSFTVVVIPSGVNPNMISWWKAEGNMLDSVGSNHGQGKNGATFAAGEVGQAFNLDGVDDYVQVSAPQGLPLGRAARTVELWFRTTKNLSTSSESSLFQYGSFAPDQMFGLITSMNARGKLYFWGGYDDLAGSTVIQPNVWYHAAVTYDGTTVRLYLNGKLETSRGIVLNTVLDANGLMIGYRSSSSLWSGQLDEVSLYNRALTGDEIAAIYAAGSNGKFNAPTIVLQPQSQTAPTGSNVTFTVAAVGAAPLAYQWHKNNSPLLEGARISGVLTPTLTISSLQDSDAGNYFVIVSNAFGAVTSAVATLTVKGVTNLDTGLLAYYPFDTDAKDHSGHPQMDLLNAGGVPAEGIYGLAYQFRPGTYTYGTNLNLTQLPLSISFWFKARSFQPIGSKLLCNWGYPAGISYRGFQIDDSGQVIYCLAGREANLKFLAVPHQSNTWHHLVACYDATGAAVYLNGVYQGRIVTPLEYQPNNSKLWIGGRGTPSDDWWGDFDGGIDEVRVYDRLLAPGEIQLLYQQTGAGPMVTTQPQSRTNLTGTTATFNVGATGSTPLAYQWRKDGVFLADGGKVSGATGPSLVLANVQMADAGNYQVVITNAFGAATSQVAKLTIIQAGVAPEITAQPQSRTNPPGTMATFGVQALGTPTLNYQWRFNGMNLVNGGRISGAVSPALVVSSVQTSDAGNYTVVVTNAYGSVTSQVAVLAVSTTAPGTKRWEFATGGEVVSSPAIGADGTVYVGSFDSKVYALEGATGAKHWEFQTGSYVFSSPALGTDGTVYVGSYDRKLYALNGATGAKRWEFETAGVVTSSAAIGDDGTVYVGSHDGKCYALDGATGQLRWTFTTGGAINSSPAIGSDGTVYVGSYDRKLYALNGATGAKRWEFLTGNQIHSSPAIGADGTIYVGSYDRKVYAVNGATGQQRWAFTTGKYIWCGPTIGPDGTVYIGSHDFNVYALDGATGQRRWVFATGSYVGSSPAMGGDGTLYVGSCDGRMYALDSVSGQKRWEYVTGREISPSPAIATNGTVYFGAHDGKVYALYSDSVNGLADSPWPMFRQNVRHTGRAVAASATAPVIIAQPVSQTAAVGTNVTLGVIVAGQAPLVYRWWLNGTLLPGATNANLTLNNIQLTNAGDYSVVVTNAYGAVTSAVATLTLTPAAASLRASGVGLDGYIAGATVFFDANRNGEPDENEPATLTDDQGRFDLQVPRDAFDLNQNGQLEVEEGCIVLKGGLDIATGQPLRTALTAPAGSTVVNPLTTLLQEVLDQIPGLPVPYAQERVQTVLGLSNQVDFTTYDPFAAAQTNDSNATPLLRAAAQVQDTTIQIAALLEGASTGLSSEQAARQVTSVLAAHVTTHTSLTLDAPQVVHNVLIQAVNDTGVSLDADIATGAANVIAEVNQMHDQVARTATNALQAAEEISRIAGLAQGTISDDLAWAAADLKSIDDVVANNTGVGLAIQIAAAPVGDVTGQETRSGTFAFSQPEFSVLEDGTPLSAVTVIRNDGNLWDVRVRVSLSDGTARSMDGDYVAGNIDLQFASGQISQTVNLSPALIDDGLAENYETINLALSLLPGAPSQTLLGAQNHAVVTITDNDLPGTFSFTTAQYQVQEDGTPISAVTIKRENGSADTVSLIVTPIELPDGAKALADYVPTPIQVTFQPGNMNRLVTIPVMTDSLFESDEPLQLNLTLAPNAPPGAHLGVRTSATLTIRDSTTAAPFVQLLVLSPGPGGEFKFSLTGTPGRKCIVQQSPNLVDWMDLSLHTLENVPPVVTGPPRPSTVQRFYRALLLP